MFEKKGSEKNFQKFVYVECELTGSPKQNFCYNESVKSKSENYDTMNLKINVDISN